MSVLTDYKPLSAHDFHLSKIGGFGLLGSRKILLTRKPVKCLYRVDSGKDACLDLSIITSRKESERGAVKAEVRCFSAFGKALTVASRWRVQDLFADAKHCATPQRIWLPGTPGARWALVTLARQTNQRRIGVSSNFQTQRVSFQSAQRGDIEQSRDRMFLENAYRQAFAEADRPKGRAILEQLIYCWQSDAYRQQLAVLQDAEELAQRGLPSVEWPAEEETQQGVYDYKKPFLEPYNALMPLSKWVRMEAGLVIRAAQAGATGTIRVSKTGSLPELFVVGRLLEQHTSLKVVGAEADSPPKLGWLSTAELVHL